MGSSHETNHMIIKGISRSKSRLEKAHTQDDMALDPNSQLTLFPMTWEAQPGTAAPISGLMKV